ncbi:MAG: type I restriction-modification system subunit M [Dysgonamonadaceae bacterium]|nr:type I restriction-modification system subunit M [Dysgonamonadaceae bacterium]
MNKQQLAAKIWESANKMRSKIEANEYKDYILGFIFYKFLSEKQEQYLIKEDWTREDLKELKEDNEEIVTFCQKNLGYFISYEDLFSTWIKKGKEFDVANVRDALSAFNRLISTTHKKVYEKIFDTLQTGLSKLGDTSGSQTKAISELIQIIKDIPMDGTQDYDVLGFIYEYLISNFAANAGKKAGEFYTPHEVSLLMSEIISHHLQDRETIKIYDPTSGSGSLLINIGRAVSKHINNKDKIKYYAQELKENTYNLTRMNLIMRGILPDNIVTRCGDTLEEDWPYFDESDPTNTYDPLYVDAVVSNPPYSQAWDPTDKESDPRYARFGLAPKSKADYAFLLHDLYHVKPDGIMTIVLPHGVLFRGGEEGNIRKNLIEQNHIDAIIGLPSNIFYGTGIPTIIMVLKQKRENTDVLIVNASKGFVKVGKTNQLQSSDIKKIVDTVIGRKNIEKYSRVISKEEIRQNDYNLNIPRYVDSSESPESWDIFASINGGIPNSEINELSKYWNEFPNLKQLIFKSNNTPYSTLFDGDISDIITNSPDIKEFTNKFEQEFNTLSYYLKERLISNMNNVIISKEDGVISENIFDRLKFTSIIDKYKAYQLFSDNWKEISIDLEVIQSDGTSSIKAVEPNMVVKKKDSKDVEVQEGWKGKILPFELVQENILKEEIAEVNNKENRLENITAEYEEILDSLSEEDKESDVINEDKTAFVNAEIIKQAKLLEKSKEPVEEASLEERILKVSNLIVEERSLKSEIKKAKEELHLKTKSTIENLSDELALTLLEKKWIFPIIESIYSLPTILINNLTTKIKELSEKYSTTLLDIENEIKEAEKSLSSMLEELEGNEFDMKGLEQFKNLLKGGENE